MNLEFHLASFQKDTRQMPVRLAKYTVKKDPAPASAEIKMLESNIFIMVVFLD